MNSDFDKLANLTPIPDHNAYYHDYLLQHMPQPCAAALDIGCGSGDLARRIASRAGKVVAIDNSQGMLELAKENSRDFPNIEYRLEDATNLNFPDESFDYIVSVAALHHLPMNETLNNIKRWLKPGGSVAILDIHKLSSVGDRLIELVAIPLNFAMRLIKAGRIFERSEVRVAWEEHGKRDRYLTIREIKEICAKILPGAVVRRHVFWRYSIVWKK